MNNIDREKFWNVLKDIHDNSAESVQLIKDASPWPKTICRFRTVSEYSLQQLSENKLFFSSADHYDDPFDTYFYINVDQMLPIYEKMRKEFLDGNKGFADALHSIVKLTGQDPKTFVSMLLNSTPDFTGLKHQLMMVRESMQRRLFSICFCDDPYNEALWLKYAENYSGYVLIYDLTNSNTFLCGKEENCQNCILNKERPNIYPIYYSDIKYDATKYAAGVWLMDKIAMQNNAALKPLYDFIQNALMWEVERISLIKKKRHEPDQEWRMIRPAIYEQQSFIKMKPSKVIIGLRTPDYKSRLIVSAAMNAGIKEIHKLYINESDELDSYPVQEKLYHI